MTVKCGAELVPGLTIEKFLFSPRKPEIMDEEMSPSSAEKKWSTESGKRFDDIRKNVEIGDEPKKSPNSSRLSFSVDSLLSSFRRNKDSDRPERRNSPEIHPEAEKPELEEDEEELDVEDDSDEFVDDDDDVESGSNRFSMDGSNPLHPELAGNHPGGMPPFLAAFLAAAASSSNPAGSQFRPVPNWPMSGFGFPGMHHPHHHLFKTGSFKTICNTIASNINSIQIK